MKRNLFCKYIFVLFTLISLLFASCGNIFDELESEEKATLYINLSDNVGRNVLPDTSLTDFTDFRLTGSKGESTEVQNLGSWSNAAALSNASVEIDNGEWCFTLSAKKDDYTFSGTTRLNVKSGEVNTASFILMPEGSVRNAKVDITLRFPENAGVNSVFCKIEDFRSSIDVGASETKNSLTASLTNNTFTLKGTITLSDSDKQKSFQCNFYSFDGTCLGSYLDEVGLLPGLTSKLDYTIEYLSDLGFTKLESTDNGIEFTINVPKGIENVDVYRRLSGSDDYYYIMSKYFGEKTTEKTTISDADCFDYENGKSYEYYVLYNWGIQSPHKVVRATKDGWPMPEFTTYPVFETEFDSSTGKSTKLKIVNTPVLDFKGHGEGYSYSIDLNYEDFFYPNFTTSKTENEISDKALVPGGNKVLSYTYKIRKENSSLDRIFIINSSNLGANLPPVLQGEPAAVATNDGIKIRVYTTSWSGNVELKRSISPDGHYTTIATSVNNISEDVGYFEYLDKYDLNQGTEYYYTVGNQWRSYGGDYFSAVSQVTKGSPVEIKSEPSLTLSENSTIGTFTPGVLEVKNESLNGLVPETYFTYISSDLKRKIVIYYTPNKNRVTVSGIYDSTDYISNLYEREYDCNSVELYNEEFDGETFTLLSAVVKFGSEYSLDLGDKCCPQEIVLPNRNVNLQTEATANGIKLTLSNIPEKTTSLWVYSKRRGEDITYGLYTFNQETDWATNEVTQYVPTSIELLDTNVDIGTEYGYHVDLYYLVDDKSEHYTGSVKNYIQATGGDGELFVTATSDSNTNGIVLTCPEGIANITRQKKDYNDKNAREESIYLGEGFDSEVSDPFVTSGKEYIYSIDPWENKETDAGYSYIYYPHSKKILVTAKSGSGEVKINNTPVIYYDNSAKKLLFSIEPSISGIDGMNVNDLLVRFGFYLGNESISNKPEPTSPEGKGSVYWYPEKTETSISDFQPGIYSFNEDYSISFSIKVNNKTLEYNIWSRKTIPGFAVN